MSTSPHRRWRHRRLTALACAIGLAGLIPAIVPDTSSTAEAAAIQVIPLETPGNAQVTLGALGSRSQSKPVTIAGIGPYAITGTDSVTGQPYTFVTDMNYTASLEAYRHESDMRATTSVTTGFGTVNFDGRTDVLQLTSSGNCNSGNPSNPQTYCSAFGPEVYSEPFTATVGQAVSFEWAASGASDDYEIYAYLVKVEADAGQPGGFDYGSEASHTLLAYGRGDSQSWTTSSGDITEDGSYRFRFVNGTYDATGGLAIGAVMYIDSAVRIGTANPITFDTIGDKLVNDDPFTISASAPGGAVTFTSLTTGKCTVSGETVTLLADQSGICTIVANQPGDGVTYVPAASVAQSFTIRAAATAPVNSGVPLIFGTDGEGETLTMTEGTWADGGSPITGTTIQWRSTVGGETSDISGVTGNSCVLVPLEGSTITVAVTKTNAVGSTTAVSTARTSGFTCEAAEPPPPPPPPSSPDPERVGGGDRHETATKVSEEFFFTGASTVYLATSQTFADALVAGVSAGLERGPVLLSQHSALPAATRTELERLSPTTIVIVGGHAAISPAVEAAAGEYAATVIRLGGTARYGTAVELSQRSHPDGAAKVYIAAGMSFADSIAGGPVAAIDGAPILLVRRDAIPAATAAELERLAPDAIVILGGTDVVSASVETALAGYATTVSRRGGADRYETSAIISRAMFSPRVPAAFLATGTDFPDGLTAAPPAAMKRGPVLLVRPTCVPASVAAELERIDPFAIYGLGESGAVSDEVMKLTVCTD